MHHPRFFFGLPFIAGLIFSARDAARSEKDTDAAKGNRQFADCLTGVNAEVFPRHLPTMTGASWKDTKGVHIDQWLD